MLQVLDPSVAVRSCVLVGQGTGDTLRLAEERGRDDAESHRGEVGFLLHRTGDGGWSGLAGNPQLRSGELLMAAPQSVLISQVRSDLDRLRDCLAKIK